MRRLRNDRVGNVMTITALSIIPLIAMAGSALDMSRAYLIKNRLQQSCDAAVLAGRRKMGADAWSTDVEATANRYFRSNFPAGSYASETSTIAYTVAGDKTVTGRASVTMPMAIMQIMGISNMNLTASCDARLDLPNADVMFVLDTTLSMLDTNPGDTTNRLVALKDSVPKFVEALETAKQPGTRTRYGFVPYSSTVNVGMLLKPEWLVSRGTYQSRVADGTDTTTSTQGATNTTYTAFVKVSGELVLSNYTIPRENCVAPANTNTNSSTYSAWVNHPTDGSRSREQTETVNGKVFTATIVGNTCRINVEDYQNYVRKRTQTERPNPNAGTVTTSTRYWWKYKPVEYDVSALKAVGSDGKLVGGSLTALVGDNHTNRTASWTKANACIEERQTTATTTASSPGTGFDLDVDTKPTVTDPLTQWKPMLRPYTYARQHTGFANFAGSPNNWKIPEQRTNTNYAYYSLSNGLDSFGACPTYARKLEPMTKAAVTTYMAELVASGRTYHDVGFLWGLRLLSAQGIFDTDNLPPSTGGAVARHLIFMTDGQTETNIGDYETYGVSALERRRTPSTRLPTVAEQNTLIENRLAGLCAVAKGKGITVWMIAFGTSLNSTFTGCASQGHSFAASNSTELNTAFASIASNIAQLRLTR